MITLIHEILIYFVVVQYVDAEMSIIEDYLKNAGGNWLKAETVHDGYKLKVQNVWLDDETFDKSYICVAGINQEGESVQARLGVQNVQRVADVLGSTIEEWTGNYLEVIGLQSYPNFANKGILWRGVKAKPKPKQQEVEDF